MPVGDELGGVATRKPQMDAGAWPRGRGEMAERIRRHDWAATPLGPVPSWPPSLVAAVELMLASAFPTSVLWGREAILLYNDAAVRVLVPNDHPVALGRPVYEALPTISSQSALARVMGGESVTFGKRRHVVRDAGREREIWFDQLASPVRDEVGVVVGAWMVVVDVTARIEAERRRRSAEAALRGSEARQRFLLRLTDELRAMADPAGVEATATRMTGAHFGVDRCCYGVVADGTIAPRASWSRGAAPPGDEKFALAPYAAALVREGGRAVVCGDAMNDGRLTRAERESLRDAGTAAFMCVNLGGEAVFAVRSAAPRAWTDHEIEAMREAGERTLLATRRAAAETALRESEARFRQFAAASTNILTVRDAKTAQLEYRSPGFTRTFSDAFEHAGSGDALKDWLEIVLPDDRHIVSDAIARTRAGEQVTAEYRITRPQDGEVRWLHCNIFPLKDDCGNVQRIGTIGYDATDGKRTGERMEALVAELQHRTRNLMAVLQSIVAQTMAGSADFASFKERLDDRLRALSRAQSLLSRSDQKPITIGAMVRLELGAVFAEAPPGRIEITGPDVNLRHSSVQLLALALHELAAGASAHGALSTDRGRLRVSWQVVDLGGVPHVKLDWTEAYPAGAAGMPEDRSFCRELIERALPYSLNAKTSCRLDPTGLQCSITLPLTRERRKERGA